MTEQKKTGPKRLVEKGWGHEEIWASNDRYCGKLLDFHEGGKCSMHFHLTKHETWRVLSGEYVVTWINPQDAARHQTTLLPGDVWINKPGQPHQVTCTASGVILEVSTSDWVEDNYRIEPGDSQR